MTTVRRATELDASGIGAVHAEAWRIAYRDLFDPEFLSGAVEGRTQMWTEKAEAFADEDAELLVAECEQRVVGFAHSGWRREDPAEQEVYAFYVHPTSWGRGVAPVLMTSALERLRQRSPGRVVLWTLRDAARARAFYGKTGWRASGQTRLHDFGQGVARPLTQYAR